MLTTYPPPERSALRSALSCLLLVARMELRPNFYLPAVLYARILISLYYAYTNLIRAQVVAANLAVLDDTVCCVNLKKGGVGNVRRNVELVLRLCVSVHKLVSYKLVYTYTCKLTLINCKWGSRTAAAAQSLSHSLLSIAMQAWFLLTQSTNRAV
jgi:hypothetical protein